MKNLYIILFCMILLVGTVSAFEFDNRITYENNDLKVKIDNGFGLFGEIGTAELKSHKSVDEVLDVGIGGNKPVMYYDFNFAELYLGGLGQVQFIDMKTGEEVEVPYHFAYLGDVFIPEYDLTCQEVQDKNGTYYSSCSTKEVGSHLEKQWIKLNATDIPKGVTRIALIVEYMPKNKWYDAVWTIAGKKVTKHAEFSSWLKDRLVSCWTLDETSGTTAIDYGPGQLNNGTNNHGVVIGVPSQVASMGNAYYFNKTSTSNISMIPSASLNISNDFSLGVVFNSSAPAGDNQIAGGRINTAGYHSAYTGGVGFTKVVTSGGATAVSGVGTGISEGGTNMMITTHSEANSSIFVNGALNVTTASASGTITNSNTWALGGTGAFDGFGGYLSEVWLLNYTMNSTDASDLWAGGTIISCAGLSQIIVNLIHPEDNANFSINDLYFTSSVSDSGGIGITNVTVEVWNTNGSLAYNNTNTSTFTGIYNWSVSNLPDGNYNWTSFAYGDNNALYTSSNGSLNFTIDTTPPQINISSPVDGTNYAYLLQGNNLTLNTTITELNLDTVWYEYNGTNTTITGAVTATINTTNLTLTNESIVRVWANDTSGLTNSSTTDWTFTVFDFNNYTYTTSVVETTTNAFSGDFQTSDTLTVSYLEYNNTNTSATISTLDTLLYRVSASVTSPSVAADSNISWNFWINNINATDKNQTVINLLIDDCSSYSNVVYNFTIYDEENPSTKLTNTTSEYAFNILDITGTDTVADTNKSTLANPFAICLNSPLTNNLAVTGAVRFYANDSDTSYAVRYYNFLNNSITNTTLNQNISLYAVNSSRSLPFLLTFRDSNLALAPNILVRVQKQYLPLNTFLTVEIPLTDTNGQTILNLIRNTAVYNLIMTNSTGQIVTSFTNVIAFCQDYTIGSCSIDLAAPSGGELAYNYSSSAGISYTIGYSNSSKLITLTFNSVNSSNQDVNLVVTTPNQFENRSVCDTSLTSASGSLTCNISDYVDTNQYFYADVNVNGEYVSTEYINANPSLASTGGAFGSAGFFLALLVFLVMVLMFSDDKQVLVVSLLIGWVAVVSLGLLKGAIIGSSSGGIWLLITVIIFVWKLKQEETF